MATSSRSHCHFGSLCTLYLISFLFNHSLMLYLLYYLLLLFNYSVTIYFLLLMHHCQLTFPFLIFPDSFILMFLEYLDFLTFWYTLFTLNLRMSLDLSSPIPGMCHNSRIAHSLTLADPLLLLSNSFDYILLPLYSMFTFARTFYNNLSAKFASSKGWDICTRINSP